MKKIFLLVAVFTSALVQSSFAQNTHTPEILNSTNWNCGCVCFVAIYPAFP